MFCPWIRFRATPLDMCGVRVMGLQDAEQILGAEAREALRRARLPYTDHFLNEDQRPRPFNDNSLLYVVNPC